jgi:hypothetical protein
MGVKLAAASGGSIELVPTNTASNFTVTVPAGTAVMAIDGPAFSAYQSSSQTVTLLTFTKILFQTEEFDTNNNFASSTFTPTVAGYYLITSAIEPSSSQTYQYIFLYKNGSNFKQNSNGSSPGTGSTLSTLIYFNGSTDYAEIYTYLSATSAISASFRTTYFQASMVRGA